MALATAADDLTLLQAQLERSNLLLAKMGASTPETDQQDEAVGTVLVDVRPADTPCCCHSEQIIKQKSTSGDCKDNK